MDALASVCAIPWLIRAARAVEFLIVHAGCDKLVALTPVDVPFEAPAVDIGVAVVRDAALVDASPRVICRAGAAGAVAPRVKSEASFGSIYAL